MTVVILLRRLRHRLCWIAANFCGRRYLSWYRRTHPFWDCSAGKPKQWSVWWYGTDRPQDVICRRWERWRDWFRKLAG